ncbi:MAG: family 16 glycoside hydrolase [Vicinamibacterales bacterium]
MQRPHIASLTLTLAILAAASSSPVAQGPAPGFVPDTVFAGSDLGNWTRVGDGTWTAESGEVTGRAGPGGGWLVLGTAYQDLNFFTRFQCTAPCDAGVLFRLRDEEAGRTGVFVSLADDDLGTYRVTLDADGRISRRDRLRAVGPFLRSALPASSPDAQKPPSPTGAGRGGAPIALPTPLPELEPPAPGIRPGEWNRLSVVVDSDVVRPTLNGGLDFTAGATEDRMGYGPVALYVGSGQVRFRDLAFKDLREDRGPGGGVAAIPHAAARRLLLRVGPAPETSTATASSTSSPARSTTSGPTS